MVNKVNISDIENLNTSGEAAARLINDTKRAINEIIDSGSAGIVPVNMGGTGATTPAEARANLGAASTDVATPISNGLLSKEDKVKIDNMSGGGIQSITDGDNITVDNTDPENPEISFDGSDGITIGTGTNAVDYGKEHTLAGIGSPVITPTYRTTSFNGATAQIVDGDYSYYSGFRFALLNTDDMDNDSGSYLGGMVTADLANQIVMGLYPAVEKDALGRISVSAVISVGNGSNVAGLFVRVNYDGKKIFALSDKTENAGDAEDIVTRSYIDDSVIDITSLVESSEYTLQPQDHGKLLVYTAGAAIDLICPDGLTIPTGETGKFVCSVMQLGTGVISVTVDGTSTVTNPDGALYDTAGQYREIKLFTLDGSAYVLKGEAA